MYKSTVSHYIGVSQDEEPEKQTNQPTNITRNLSDTSDFSNLFQASSKGLFHIGCFSSAPNFFQYLKLL